MDSNSGSRGARHSGLGVALVCSLLTAQVLCAAEDAETTQPIFTAEQQELGQAAYLANCANGCHRTT